MFESHIPSLQRIRAEYADGTEVTFCRGFAVSLVPGELAEPHPDGGFVIRGDEGEVQLDLSVVNEQALWVDECCKQHVEEDFWFDVPGCQPALYDGAPFTPSLANGPYVRSYLLQFGAPHFFWPQPGGYDWCPRCHRWHRVPTQPSPYWPPGRGYYSLGIERRW